VALRLPAHLAALDGLPPDQARQAAFVLAAHDAFVAAALICSIGIVASLLRGGGRPVVAAGPGEPRV